MGKLYNIDGNKLNLYNKIIPVEYPIGGEKVPITKAHQRAVDKYVKANYDRIEIKVPKGHKAEIKAHAETQGESVNGFINRAITSTMQCDTQKQ